MRSCHLLPIITIFRLSEMEINKSDEPELKTGLIYELSNKFTLHL